MQISQQDIDNFKAEIEKRQKEHSPDDGEVVLAITEKDSKKNDKEIKKATGKKIEKVEQKTTKDLEASKIGLDTV